MPFPYPRLIVGRRHCRVLAVINCRETALAVSNINSEATGFGLTLPALKRRGFLRLSSLNIPIARVSGRNPFAKNGGLLS